MFHGLGIAARGCSGIADFAYDDRSSLEWQYEFEIRVP